MPGALDSDRLQSLGDDPAAQYARAIIAQMQTDLKFQQTRIAALSFELARLKQWRFGQSSEALDTQGQLFDTKTQALLQQEEQAEDRAAEQERRASPKRTPKRQPLPGQLDRIEHRDEIDSGLCAVCCGPHPDAHRRGDQRAARLRAYALLRAPAHPRQVRLRLLPDCTVNRPRAV